MGLKILIELFFLTQNRTTRGHQVTLINDQCRLDIRKYSLSQGTVNEWNKLSTDCVTASSVNMFNGWNIFQDIISQGFTYMKIVGVSLLKNITFGNLYNLPKTCDDNRNAFTYELFDSN